jgi:valyl-tRNA synthetase
VLDTWATSSLTPQIVGGWSRDEELFANVFPFDLRPQAHEIIRTWLFSTAVRADALQNAAPWKHAAISGWVLDPDRKKMSKSKGNVIVPTDVLEEFGSDAVRYWATSAKLGADTAYEIGQMKIGRRLAIKLLNASKFVLNLGATDQSVLAADDGGAAAAGAMSNPVTNPLDLALLAQLADVVEQATASFESYDYARALQLTESFFWSFTDNYVELVKDRAYGAAGESEQASVLATLATTLDALLRLFAPFIPFATEEVWSWWRTGSVHRAAWPEPFRPSAAVGAGTGTGSATGAGTGAAMLATVGAALSGIRKAKSEAKVKQRTEVISASIAAPAYQLRHLQAGLGDLKAAGNARRITLLEGTELTVSDVVLAPADEPAKA